jgi:hypothetical protein
MVMADVPICQTVADRILGHDFLTNGIIFRKTRSVKQVTGLHESLCQFRQSGLFALLLQFRLQLLSEKYLHKSGHINAD